MPGSTRTQGPAVTRARANEREGSSFGPPSAHARATSLDLGVHLERASVFGHALGRATASPVSAPIQRTRKDKAGLRSAKFNRRYEQDRRRAQIQPLARSTAPAQLDPLTGGGPTGNIGVLLTLLMLASHIQGAHGQQQPGPQPPGRRLAPGPRTPSLLAPPTPVVPRNETIAARNTTHTALATLPIVPNTARVGGHVNATVPHVHIATSHNAAPNTTAPNTTAPNTTAPNTTAPPRSPPRPAPRAHESTIVGKDGKLAFGSDKERTQHASKPNSIESLAINNLLRTTPTGRDVLDGLSEVGAGETIIRMDLGRDSGEADLSNKGHIKVNSNKDLRANAITAAHEFRHREQFGHGILDQNSNPYRKAAAEIEAKLVGVKTYRDLEKGGYFADDPSDLDPYRLDSRDERADPQKYKRDVFRMYLTRYRGAQSAKYPDFASDQHLDAHIAAQEQYFAARRELSRAEAAIKMAGMSPDDTKNLPEALKRRLFEARAENRRAHKAAEKTQPKASP